MSWNERHEEKTPILFKDLTISVKDLIYLEVTLSRWHYCRFTVFPKEEVLKNRKSQILSWSGIVSSSVHNVLMIKPGILTTYHSRNVITTIVTDN